MKTNVADTSREAYHSDKMKTNEKTVHLIAYSLRVKRFTCVMAATALSKQLGYTVYPSTLSGIISNQLIPAGTFIRERSKFPCEETHNNAHWMSNKDYTPQAGFFN